MSFKADFIQLNFNRYAYHVPTDLKGNVLLNTC